MVPRLLDIIRNLRSELAETIRYRDELLEEIAQLRSKIREHDSE